MAGVKGRSGGARPNTGGARPGSGRKPAPPVFSQATDEEGDAERFLKEVIRDVSLDMRVRLDAAKALIAYQKPKMGETGKKDAKNDAAKAAASGRFAAPAPPKLTLVRSA